MLIVLTRKGGIIVIKLDVLDACENCLDFEPVSTSGIHLNGDVFHRVTCENISKCQSLLKHLQMEVDKDGN